MPLATVTVCLSIICLETRFRVDSLVDPNVLQNKKEKQQITNDISNNDDDDDDADNVLTIVLSVSFS